MGEQENQNSIIAMLSNITRDTGQIKTDLAINTTKTGYIEEHLRVLNGKVVKQEERQQLTDKELQGSRNTIGQLVNSKRRWDDGWLGALKQLGIFILGLASAYIIKRYFN